MALTSLLSALTLTSTLLISTAQPNYPWTTLVSVPDDAPAFSQTFLPKYINFTHDLQIYTHLLTQTCQNDLHAALRALQSRTNWAVELFNSWGKLPPSGFTSGTLTDFGDYTQCLGIASPVITSQYCLLDIALPMPPKTKAHNYHHQPSVLPVPSAVEIASNKYLFNGSLYRHMEANAALFYYLTIQVGICLPASCSANQIQAVAQNKTSPYGLSVKSLHCETKADNVLHFDGVQMVALAFLFTTCTISLFAAVYDRLYGNGDAFTLKAQASSLYLQWFFKGPYAVETFFYLSGFLTSYIILKITSRHYANFHYLPYLTLRYLRLTPQVMIYILLSFLLVPLFSGPIWKAYTAKVANCYSNWWIDLLNLQNLFAIQNACAIHTWFIATDMQLHLLALLPLVCLLLYQRRGLLVTAALVIGCSVLNAYTIYTKKFSPDLIITSKTDYRDDGDIPSSRLQFYFTPWNHAIVYFAGFVFGYFVPEPGSVALKLKKIPKYLLWLTVILLYLTVVYSSTPYLYGATREAHYSAFLFTFNRILWATLLTAIMWLCITENCGPFGRLLNWSAWKPLSRMTYAVYLTHSWVLYVVLGARRDLIDLNIRSILVLCFGTLVLCYIVAAIFTVLFESPLIVAIESFKKGRIETKSDASKAPGASSIAKAEVYLAV